MEELKQKLQEHTEKDERAFGAISETLKKIETNHLAHMQADSASMRTDISWLKWGVMLVIGGIVTLFLKG